MNLLFLLICVEFLIFSPSTLLEDLSGLTEAKKLIEAYDKNPTDQNLAEVAERLNDKKLGANVSALVRVRIDKRKIPPQQINSVLVPEIKQAHLRPSSRFIPRATMLLVNALPESIIATLDSEIGQVLKRRNTVTLELAIEAIAKTGRKSEKYLDDFLAIFKEGPLLDSGDPEYTVRVHILKALLEIKSTNDTANQIIQLGLKSNNVYEKVTAALAHLQLEHDFDDVSAIFKKCLDSGDDGLVTFTLLRIIEADLKNPQLNQTLEDYLDRFPPETNGLIQKILGLR